MRAEDHGRLSEIPRLYDTRSPGEMHPVDQAFYDLTVKQRDLAWYQLERAKERIARLEADLAVYVEAQRDEYEPGAA